MFLESFSEATRKSKTALFTSDLSSAAEFDVHTQNTKKKKSKEHGAMRQNYQIKCKGSNVDNSGNNIILSYLGSFK